MSDDISQKMMLDASNVLQQLEAVDNAFKTLSGNLGAIGSAFSSFNSGSAGVEKTLQGIASAASQASSALSKLSSVKAPSVSGGGGVAIPPAAASGAAALNAQLASVTTQFRSAQGAAQAMGNGSAGAMQNATRSSAGFAVSLETITRVISTQLIVRSLNAIRNAVEDSFQGFIKFNQAAAEIQTILDQPLKTIRDDVRQLSDAFNAPILDVAEAKYQAISNGFVTASDSTKVLTAALKFSKVGIASVTDSVDLISTSLNAYGNSADHAETISAKLFKTIELGRVVGTELANSFGRVAPVAKEIGASEDEILAAFSSITIGGVKASEAATQIRATLTALLKPSDAATDAFRKLGVESGEQLIQAKGFQGALQSLIGTTDGSASAIAKLFPNVRALNGVIRETTTGVDIFQEHLEAIQRSSADLLNKKYELRVETNSEQVATSINKLKNLFTVDLGESLVEVAGILLASTGATNVFAASLKAVAPVAAAAAVSLAGYGVILGIASAQTSLFANSSANAVGVISKLRNGVGLLIAAYAAYQAGKLIGSGVTELIEGPGRQARDAADKELEFQKTQTAAQENLNKIAGEKKLKLVNSAVADIGAAYYGEVDAAKGANDELIANDKATLDKIISAHTHFATDLRRAAAQAQTDIVASEKKTNDVKGQLADAQFNFQSKRYSDIGKAYRDQQRALSLSDVGGKLLSGAGGQGVDKEASESAFKRAEGFAKEAASSAQTSGNISAQAQAEKTLETILQRRIAAEQAYQKTRQKDAATASKAAAEEEKKVTTLKSLSKEFLDNLNGFDKKGNPLDPKVLSEHAGKANKNLQDIYKLSFGKGSKYNVSDLFNFDALRQRLEQSVTGAEVKSLMATPDSFTKLASQIQGSFDKHDFLVSLAIDPSKLLGKSRDEQLKEVRSQLAGAGEEKSRQEAGNTVSTNADKEIEAARKQLNESYDSKKGVGEQLSNLLQDVTSGMASAASGTTRAFKDQLSALRGKVHAAANGPGASRQIGANLANALDTLNKDAPKSMQTDFDRAAVEVTQLARIILAREQKESQTKSGVSPEALKGINSKLDKSAGAAGSRQLQSAAQGLVQPTREASASTEAMAAGTRQAAEQASLLSQFMQGVRENAEAAAAASQNIKAPEGGPGAAGHALGGLVGHYANGGLVRYMAGGGFVPKGTDTVPAMLSPNEFIVPAGPTKKFYSQLQSIRAGVQPDYKAGGGVVNNTHNYGDVHVHESSNPRATAREVSQAQRRQQRLG